MAASGEESALGQLGQEATCPLCLDLFQQPMVLACGHNFCRDCLARLGAEASCPQCRARVEPGSAYPNRALANIVGLVKGLRLSGGGQEGSSDPQLCREHQQPLQTFCSSEKCLLCAGCLGGHQGHPLLSLPEAAQEYKDLLDALLEPLRMEEKQLLEQRWTEEQNRQECQEQLATEKQKVSLALGSLQQLLKERQSVWVAWLAEQEEEMEAEWVGPLAQLNGEASRLQQLIAQTDRKCRQPDWEFLQDIQGTVDRCQSYVVGRVKSVSPGLQGRTVLEKNASVRQMLDSYKASLQWTLTRENLEQPLATAPAPQKPRSPKVDIKIDSSVEIKNCFKSCSSKFLPCVMATPTSFSFSAAAKDRKYQSKKLDEETLPPTELLHMILNEVKALRSEVNSLKVQIQAINQVRSTQERVFPPMVKRPGGLID